MGFTSLEQQREYMRGWRERNPDYQKSQHFKHNYGLSEEDYLALVEKFEGRCGICGIKPKPDKNGRTQLTVDHDHVTGLVRGMLCHGCNRGLGMFGDNEQGVERVLKYLRTKEPAWL